MAFTSFVLWFFTSHPWVQLYPMEDLRVPSEMDCCHQHCLWQVNRNRSPSSVQPPNHKELRTETTLYYGSSQLFWLINLKLFSWGCELSMKRNNQRHRPTSIAFSLPQYWPYGSSVSPSVWEVYWTNICKS